MTNIRATFYEEYPPLPSALSITYSAGEGEDWTKLDIVILYGYLFRCHTQVADCKLPGQREVYNFCAHSNR